MSGAVIPRAFAGLLRRQDLPPVSQTNEPCAHIRDLPPEMETAAFRVVADEITTNAHATLQSPVMESTLLYWCRARSRL